MKIAMRKSGGVLAADNQQALDVLAKIKEGQSVMADVRQSRNVQNHKRFFAFLQAVFDMQENFETPEHLRHWMLMKAGWYTSFSAPNGHIMFVPKSMDFASMDEIEFKYMFSRCIDVAVKDLELDRVAIERVIEFA